MTFSHPPADLGYALSLLAGLVVTSKFTFFNKCIGRADKATNAQTSPMLDVSRNFIKHPILKKHIVEIPEPFYYDLRLLFFDVEDFIEEYQSFLRHINLFILDTEKKLDQSKLYDIDCCDYQFAGSFGYAFRNSLIVSICSASESYIKNYIKICESISKLDVTASKSQGMMNYLKNADKDFFKIGLDYNATEILEFKGLIALRNSIVHSSSTFDDVLKYKDQIIRLAKKYSSIEIFRDKHIIITEEFCKTSFEIVNQFLFYIIKKAIKKYYPYISRKEYQRICDQNFC